MTACRLRYGTLSIALSYDSNSKGRFPGLNLIGIYVDVSPTTSTCASGNDRLEGVGGIEERKCIREAEPIAGWALNS